MIVPFQFSLIMILVVLPCLGNIFMVLLISALATIGAMKPIFLDSGLCVRGHGLVLLHSLYIYTKFK